MSELRKRIDKAFSTYMEAIDKFNRTRDEYTEVKAKSEVERNKSELDRVTNRYWNDYETREESYNEFLKIIEEFKKGTQK